MGGSYCFCSNSKTSNSFDLPLIPNIIIKSNNKKKDSSLTNEIFSKKLILESKIKMDDIKENDYSITNYSSITEESIEKLFKTFSPLEDKIRVETIQLNFTCEGDYRGEWNPVKKERHGRGIQKWVNSEYYDIYFGYWKNNKINGKGKKIYQIPINDNIDIFGEIKNLYYDGEWKDNFQHGKGKELWFDNTKYEGEYKNGMKSGNGKLILPDKTEYNGEFHENEINGKGIIKYPDGRIYDGEWANNKMNGFGKFTWPDGKKYLGHYINNLKDGYGEFTWPNGKKYKGYWTKGKQNEDGEIYDPVKDKWISGKWKMGVKVLSNAW